MKKTAIIKEMIERASPFCDDIQNGLSLEEVDRRRSEGLINKTKRHVTKSYAEIVFTNLVSFFNLLLIIIGILMFIAEQYSGLFFLFILFANITIGLIQDIRARKLVDKLSLITNPKATVVRNGVISDIPVDDLVLSDVLILKAGDQISIDAVVVEGWISVNESLLTGESNPIEKNIGEKVLSGSYVVSGTARLRATSVGRANYAEQLQSQVKLFKRPKSEILKSMRLLFRYIGAIVILFGVAYAITYSLQGGFSTFASFQIAIGSIAGSLVAMIPSGMYLLTSMTLAVGVLRLAYRRMLVQELYSIETLARVDVLCFDKTGTLTDGNMDVKEIIALNGTNKNDVYKYLSSLLAATKDNNQTAQAIVREVGHEVSYETIKNVPFSSDKKFAAAVFKNHGTIAFGAWEFLKPLVDEKAEIIIKKHAKNGYRVVIIVQSQSDFQEELPNDLNIIGLIILQDHIRADARANIAWFKDNNVTVKVISGDSVDTVAEIARQVGVDGAEKSISLDNIPLVNVANFATEYNVFGRVSPEQKEVLVKALRNAGHTVAMTGDGVNDILALKVADCSIAMASGADAARNVSHLVSLDSNFGKLPEVVDEGRRVINNLQRTSSLFLAKTIFAIITSMFFYFTGLFGGTNYPFLTNNLYIWEIATIGLASFFLALQKNSEQLKGSFLTNIIQKAVPGGVMQSVIVLLIYGISFAFPQFLPREAAQVMAILTFTVASYFILAKICSPLDKYRLILFLSMAGIGVAAFIFDFFLRSWGILKINYEVLSSTHILLLFVLIAVALPFYLFISKLTSKIVNRKAVA
ncbi:MAG: HAD-IC family P-type ATPase [Bacilli bacterium]|nr:HAD-IC family P-type ATPase [Bacilli bacterium]